MTLCPVAMTNIEIYLLRMSTLGQNTEYIISLLSRYIFPLQKMTIPIKMSKLGPDPECNSSFISKNIIHFLCSHKFKLQVPKMSKLAPNP